MKHTQGKWEVSKHGSTVICGDKMICVSGIVSQTKEELYEAKSNIRLIASAPELLEACKEALKYIQGHNDLEEYHTPKIECLLEQAIAKAEEV